MGPTVRGTDSLNPHSQPPTHPGHLSFLNPLLGPFRGSWGDVEAWPPLVLGHSSSATFYPTDAGSGLNMPPGLIKDRACISVLYSLHYLGESEEEEEVKTAWLHYLQNWKLTIRMRHSHGKFYLKPQISICLK